MNDWTYPYETVHHGRRETLQNQAIAATTNAWFHQHYALIMNGAIQLPEAPR